MSKTRKPHNPLTESDKDYIRENHKEKTVLEMAAHLEKVPARIYVFLDENGLSVKSKHPYLVRKVIEQPKENLFRHDKIFV